MSEVTVVSSFETDWNNDIVEVMYAGMSNSAVSILKNSGSFEITLSLDDVDTLVSLLVAYRNGFEFPPKPDPTTDSHTAFTS